MSIQRIFVLALSLGLVPAIGWSAIINVPGDFAEVRDAVDAAAPGDTVQVESGVYTERVRIRRLDGLILEGVDTGGGRPILRPGSGDDAVRVRDSSNVTITGFRMEGGERGVRIDKDTSNVSVVDNEMDGTQDGVRIKGGSGHIILNNTISNTVRGRGVRVDKASGVQVDGNVITGSAREGVRATKANGIAITNNSISASGRAGIRVKKSNNAVIGDNLLGGNVASSNGRSGIRIEKCSSVTIVNNAADDNSKYGFRVQKSSPISSVADLLGAGNTATCNGIADFRVNSESSTGGCGGGGSSTSSTSTSTSLGATTTSSTSTSLGATTTSSTSTSLGATTTTLP